MGEDRLELLLQNVLGHGVELKEEKNYYFYLQYCPNNVYDENPLFSCVVAFIYCSHPKGY